jgi:hypothetical protein
MKLLFIIRQPDPNRKNARFQGPTPFRTDPIYADIDEIVVYSKAA